MKLLSCGKVVNTHGIRGEVKIDNYCDDDFFAKVKNIFIGGEPYKVVSSRNHKGFALVTLQGIDSVEKAMALKNKEVTADRDAIRLPKGHFFYSDIYGFDVYDFRHQAVIGTLKEVREYPTGMMYVIACQGGECLLPEVDAFYKGVDFEKKQVLVETIVGMLPNEN